MIKEIGLGLTTVGLAISITSAARSHPSECITQPKWEKELHQVVACANDKEEVFIYSRDNPTIKLPKEVKIENVLTMPGKYVWYWIDYEDHTTNIYRLNPKESETKLIESFYNTPSTNPY